MDELKIVSDGTPSGTRIFIGEMRLIGVQSIEFKASVNGKVEAKVKTLKRDYFTSLDEIPFIDDEKTFVEIERVDSF